MSVGFASPGALPAAPWAFRCQSSKRSRPGVSQPSPQPGPQPPRRPGPPRKKIARISANTMNRKKIVAKKPKIQPNGCQNPTPYPYAGTTTGATAVVEPFCVVVVTALLTPA